jgi:hypothetical protein
MRDRVGTYKVCSDDRALLFLVWISICLLRVDAFRLSPVRRKPGPPDGLQETSWQCTRDYELFGWEIRSLAELQKFGKSNREGPRKRWDFDGTPRPSFWGFFFKVRTLKKNIFRTKDFFFVGGKKILFFFHHEKNFLTRKYFFFEKKLEKKGQKKTPKKGGPYP